MTSKTFADCNVLADDLTELTGDDTGRFRKLLEDLLNWNGNYCENMEDRGNRQENP